MRLCVVAVFLVACGARTDLGGVSHDDTADAAPPVKLAFARVACGERHTCALRADGAVFCWGLNTSAQTSADPSAASPPVRVPLSAPAKTIALGAYHSCAVVSDHVYCWGDDLVGQIGGDGPYVASPLPIGGISEVVDVSGGFSHTCALLATGGVACWGQNSAGELGDGSTQSSATAVGALVTGATALARSAGGSQHTCAIVEGGAVRCWGSNVQGEIGAGSLDASEPSPKLAIPAGAVSVAVVDYSSCAVISDGTLQCWGDDSAGQLGDGTHISSPVPVKAAIGEVKEVAVGAHHACALQGIGRVWCWGRNDEGQLGDGTTAASVEPEVAITSGAIDVCAGEAHTCAAMADGRVLCWGHAASGELGAAAPGDHSTQPIPVDGL